MASWTHSIAVGPQTVRFDVNAVSPFSTKPINADILNLNGLFSRYPGRDSSAAILLRPSSTKVRGRSWYYIYRESLAVMLPRQHFRGYLLSQTRDEHQSFVSSCIDFDSLSYEIESWTPLSHCWWLVPSRLFDSRNRLGDMRDHRVNPRGSLSARVFETRTATWREHFARQDSGVSQIFILIISNGEKILSNANVSVWRQVKRETAHFRLPSASQKCTCLSSPFLSWLRSGCWKVANMDKPLKEWSATDPFPIRPFHPSM